MKKVADTKKQMDNTDKWLGNFFKKWTDNVERQKNNIKELLSKTNRCMNR